MPAHRPNYIKQKSLLASRSTDGSEWNSPPTGGTVQTGLPHTGSSPSSLSELRLAEHFPSKNLGAVYTRTTITESISSAEHALAKVSLFGDLLAVDVRAVIQPDTPQLQKWMISFFQSQQVEMALGCVIFLNMCFVVVETDYTAMEEKSPKWIEIANVILIVIYTAELLGRLFAFRLRFFSSKTSILDMLIVLADVVFLFVALIAGHDLPNVSILRLFRLLRLGRTVKVLILFPELNRMVNCLLNTCSKVFWTGLLLAMALILWAILAVQVLHPVNRTVTDRGLYEGICDRCPHAYESVFQASLTIVQQIVAGDSWGNITLFVIDENPWALAFYLCMLLSLGLVLLNLITAMIVDGAQDARAQEDRTLAHLKDQQFAEASEKLQRLCEDMDTDCSGTLSLEELKLGFEMNENFHIAMKVLDINRNDLDTLFHILDTDKSGDVDYKEFVHQMHKMKSDDLHTLVVFIKHYVTEVHRKVSEQLQLLQKDVMAVGRTVSGAQNGDWEAMLGSFASIEEGNESQIDSSLHEIGIRWADNPALVQKVARMETLFREQWTEFNALLGVILPSQDTKADRLSRKTSASI